MSLVSTHQMLAASPHYHPQWLVTTKSASKHCQVSPGGCRVTPETPALGSMGLITVPDSVVWLGGCRSYDSAL